MPAKRFTVEEIVSGLRQADVELAGGAPWRRCASC